MDLFEYRREMDALHFTQEQKEQLVLRARSSAEKQRPAARRPFPRLAVCAIAATVLIAGCGAMAAGVVGHSFDSVFGTAQTKVINKIGRPIGASATNQGITVRAEAVIGDKYNACIVYSVKNKDGSPLKLPAGVRAQDLSFEEDNCALPGCGGSYESSWFTKNQSDGGSLQYVDALSSDQPLNQGNASVNFTNLRYYNGSSKKDVPLYSGTWQFRFPIRYEDSSVALPAGETFTKDGIRFQITSLSVSPVGMHVTYEADRQADLQESSTKDGREPEQVRKEETRYLDGISMILTKKDGTKLDLTDSGGSLVPSNGKTACTKGGIFHEIVPVGEIQSVLIGGAAIPVHSH